MLEIGPNLFKNFSLIKMMCSYRNCSDKEYSILMPQRGSCEGNGFSGRIGNRRANIDIISPYPLLCDVRVTKVPFNHSWSIIWSHLIIMISFDHYMISSDHPFDHNSSIHISRDKLLLRRVYGIFQSNTPRHRWNVF